MTLRARLTLLFLGAVEATFLSAVAAYWGLQSWEILTDDLTVIQRQGRRLATVLDRAPDAGDERLAGAVAGLRRHVQTRDESERVEELAAAVAGTRPSVREAGRRLGRYYDGELRRLRARADALSRVSTFLIPAIVGLVIAAFVGFLAAIRVWLVRPVRTLEQGTEIIATGDLRHRIALDGDDELGRLAASINAMAASLAHIQMQLVSSERFALLGELAAYIAHNIRNPLASIRATAQGEAIELPAHDPGRAAFEDIIVAADRLAAWVTDLLRSASPIVLERRPGSLGDLVTHCADLMRPRLTAAGIDLLLAVDATPATPFDQAKMEQVVSAILANASDASPRGGRIEMRLAHDGHAAVLCVSDEGPGIASDRRERLFTPFATTKASGTGLGLWLSQKIVVAHGGSITLRDGPSCGTTVEIRLPAAQEPPCPAS